MFEAGEHFRGFDDGAMALQNIRHSKEYGHEKRKDERAVAQRRDTGIARDISVEEID